jgi:hypothetical protein
MSAGASDRTPTAPHEENSNVNPLRLTMLSAAAALVLSLVCLSPTSAIAAPFGIEAFDGQVTANAAGDAYTQAAGHPYEVTTQFRLNRKEDLVYGHVWPSEPVKDIVVDTPPGLVGNPTVTAKCTLDQLAVDVGQTLAGPLCPASSQVGVLTAVFPLCLGPELCLRINQGKFPVYAMVPPPDVPARFAFNSTGIIILDARLRSNGDYGLSVVSNNTTEGIPLIGSEISFWGTPADPAHDPERSCPGESHPSQGGEPCPAGIADPQPLLRLPTACQGPSTTTIHVNSWFNPGHIESAGFQNHLPPGLPKLEPGSLEPDLLPPDDWGAPVGNSGCEEVPFEPSISVRPTTPQADSPTGLEVDLEVPQDELLDPDAIAQADLKDAVVRLPAGMSVNPSSVDGLDGCSLAQIDLHGDNTDPTCPDSSKLGTVEVQTPLLEEPLAGSVYLAKQGDNPFGSLLAIYLVAKGPGTVIKLAGEVKANAQNGQLETVFTNQPQLPFSKLHVELKSGSRAALINPPTCGPHTATATLTPWSGNAPVALQSTFQVSQGPGGGPCPNGDFDPKLSGGSDNPIGGAFTSFALRVSRADGTRVLTGLDVTLPKGLIGKPAGIPYCPEAALAAVSEAQGSAAAQLASPSCPAASQVGRVTVGAGAGPNPFYLHTGRVYWAGPYKGAPLSLAVVTPALAGPFDLGSVLVRTALRVDPESAQVRAVSDPLPTLLHGIALDLRDVRVELDRPDFVLNPTNCAPMSIEAAISGAGGASANRSEPFQVADCAALGFKPKLRLRLSGPTHRRAHPRLRATLTARKGDANIGRAAVTLPKTEFLENAHIKTICTRVQYAASNCPKGSVYGYAKAWTPLLDQPLQGPVYLRSSNHELPDLVASLDGQIHVDLVGRIDSVNDRIRNTFEAVPDAPVSKFVLTMQGGKKGLLVNNTQLCKTRPRATALFDGQNGRIHDIHPVVKTDCGKKAGGKKRGR